MKERELDYKKSMDQLLKDKDDANRQLKMMQEGEEIGSIYPTVFIIMPINKKNTTSILEEHGSLLYSAVWCNILKLTQ
jgi:hypothetical protein